MKKNIKTVSALLAAVMSVSSFAASAISITASAVDTTAYSNSQFTQHWSELIAIEKAKFPETYNGRQCYWNASSEDSFTTSPCGHGWEGYSASCQFILPSCSFYNSKDYNVIIEKDGHNQAMTYGQCAGFAVKLQTDIFQVSTIVRLQTDHSGYYTALNNKKVAYNFKVGDSVRFGGHSIFITGVNGNNLTFAQCNEDGHCAIDWDATTYHGTTITASYLKSRVEYIDRPMLTCDLNLDGKLDTDDAAIFRNTIMKDGSVIGNSGYAAYDINNDNYVDEKDYNLISHMTSNVGANTRYVNSTLRTVNSRWKSFANSDGSAPGDRFMTADGNVYSTAYNTTGGVTFYGNYDRQTKTVTVPSRVTSPATGRSYNVTEVGFFANRGPGVYMIQDIENLTVPATVQKIRPYAFQNCPLKTITFADQANSQLKIVEENAFQNCKNLQSVTFPYTLETVGKYAFQGCTSLSSVYFDDDSSFNGNLNKIDDYAFINCPNLWNVEISNNLHKVISLGSTANANVFDTNRNVTLRLPNGTSTWGVLKMYCDKDVAKFQNSKLIIYAGRYYFRDKNGIFATHSSNGIGRVYPN